MAQNQATFTIQDYDNESTTLSLNIGPLTAANFLAKRAGVDAVKTALSSIILGEIRKTSITEQFAESSNNVSDRHAQRETKCLVTYRDTTQFFDVANAINNVGFGNLYTVEIGTIDLNLLPTTSTDKFDLTSPAIAAFVTAFEAAQNSPTGGNEVEVVEMRHVGRAT